MNGEKQNVDFFLDSPTSPPSVVGSVVQRAKVLGAEKLKG